MPAVEKPFSVATVDVAAERDQPQVCFEFTEPLQRPRPRGPRYDDFVTLAPDVPHGLVVRDRSLCVDGLAHGQTFTVTLKQGLPAASGATLMEADRREVAVPNRKPVLSFRNSGYILPRLTAEGLPLRSINVSRARLQILRVGDRALVERIYNGRLNQTLTDFEVGGLLDANAQVVWRGEMAVGAQLNQPVMTPFPATAVLGNPAPGVYVAVASDAAAPADTWEFRSAQWFVVSDIGLTSFAGEDGLTVFARSLTTAQPAAQAELRLVSRSNKELGKATTGPDGLVHFSAEQLRPADGDAPQALYASGLAGDFSFLDVGGAGARAGALDVYLTSDRTAYRRGDTVKLIALLRDSGGRAVVDQPMVVRLQRPDGLEVERRRVADAGGGAYSLDFNLPSNAATGIWQVTVLPDGSDGPALASGQFQVEDVASSRVSLALDTDRPRLGADGKAVISVSGSYVSTQPAAGLPGELSVELRPAANPFPQHAGFRFGLAQDPPDPVRIGLPGFTTGAEGAAAVPVQVAVKADGSRPLEARFTATVVDVGGRPVSQSVAVPVETLPFAIGIRPQFAGDAVPEGATAAFDIMAVGPSGQPQARKGLSFELFEEELQYSWFEANGRWDYKTVVRDKRLTGGALDVAPGMPGRVEEPVRTGRYRLEVFDKASGVASSLRFSAGWWVAPRVGETPDRVEVAANPRKYKAGETASVFVRPPYDSTVVITVADRLVRQVSSRSIGAKGELVEVPVPADLTGGAYVIATAFAPGETGRNLPARRAVGMAWIAADPAPRTLGVTIDLPQAAQPRQQVTIPVKVEGAEPGVPVRVLVSAIEADGSTAATRLDPVGWMLGRRRTEIDVRDVTGSLIDSTPPGAAANGAAASAPADGDAPPSDLVALTSAVATVGADGIAPVTLDLPDFQGVLRLTAVAWSSTKLGRAAGRLEVHDPVSIEVTAPRFLAPDDSAQLKVTLRNRSGAPGSYSLKLGATGPLAVDRAKVDFAKLKRGGTASTVRVLKATGSGPAVLRLELTGPRGFTLVREIPVKLRPAIARGIVRHDVLGIDPGKGLVAALDRVPGARPDSLRGAVTVSTLPLPDMAGLMLTADAYPYGSADQTAGRILQQLPANDFARSLGLPADSDLRARVQADVDRLMALQRVDGGFALWTSEAAADPWVSPFALDALTRAREAGYRVSDASYKLGLDWLAKTIGNSWVEPFELPARSYALYVAARAKAVDPGAVRVFQDMFWAKLPTLLSRAQTAAALALAGETDRARDAFGKVEGPRQVLPGMRDLGSDLRDKAAALALMAESGLVDNDRLARLTEEVTRQTGTASHLSAEERAFLLLAGHALARKGPALSVTIGGQRVDSPEPVVRPLAPAPLAIANVGEVPVRRTLSVAGVSEAPVPQEKGYRLERKLFDLKGRPLTTARLRAGDMVVVVLSGGVTEPRPVQSLVVDLLPAGLEIETVRLGQSAPLGNLSWLADLSPASHVAFRDDRFVAAVDLTPEKPEFRVAYLARAVTPGTFRLPPSTVEDFAAPERFARTGVGTLVIAPR